MSKLCGSSEAAETLRSNFRTTLLEIRNEYTAIQRELINLGQSCRDKNYDSAACFTKEIYKQLCKILPEAVKTDQRLKEYSLFVQSLDSKFLRNDAEDAYTPSKIGAGDPKSTLQLWHREADGSYMFDSPKELAVSLDTRQGKSGLHSSCGICSVENVVIISGKDTTEAEVYFGAWKDGMCSIDGGTNWQERENILKRYHIGSHTEKQTIHNIAAAVNSGRVVILSVDARKLYHITGLRRRLHAVVVTSITVDEDGNVTGLTICDSNASVRGETGAQLYSVKELQAALTNRPMNVTDIIR